MPKTNIIQSESQITDKNHLKLQAMKKSLCMRLWIAVVMLATFASCTEEEDGFIPDPTPTSTFIRGVARTDRKSGRKGVCKSVPKGVPISVRKSVPKSVCKCVCISDGKGVGTGV